ncbi:type II toxin-antitoxin system RelE/ParE family toxin [Candidatus Gottesmanbacteria bacterium]|nr:type II toxin-antitoxin system RelE/ParE family toxin [Candidatus Gottesmanbacteria bacterium]
MYEVYYHERVDKFFTKITNREVVRILRKIEVLAQDPFQKTFDVKKMKSLDKSYRLRVGTMRIIYQIETKKQTLFIVDVDFRGNIY